jgi:C4-dicarboxylate-specific signal transduction histidine kinase
MDSKALSLIASAEAWARPQTEIQPHEAISSGMFMATLAGEIEAVNESLAAMLQTQASALCGRPVHQLVVREDQPRLLQFLDKVRHSADGGQEIPVCLHVNEGMAIEASLYLSVLRVPGRPPVLSGVLINQTQRLIREIADHFQREHRARITRLIALGEVASSIAHEINQPLTAIAAMAQACGQMLRAGKTPDFNHLSVIASEVEEQALRAAQVVKRIRGFVTHGNLRREAMAIGDLLNAVLGIVMPEARAKGTRINILLSSDSPMVEVDVIHLEQVCLNLIRNAIEAMSSLPEAQRAITIYSHQIGNLVVVTFDDAGPGVRADDREQIFEPFFTTKPDGMGLGLSTSQRIVQAHGGTLSVESNALGGARLVMTLPVMMEKGA